MKTARFERLVYLSLLLRQLHVVKDPKNNSEQVLPPVFLKGVSVGLHHFKHHRQPPGKCTHTHTHVLLQLTLSLAHNVFYISQTLNVPVLVLIAQLK